MILNKYAQNPINPNKIFHIKTAVVQERILFLLRSFGVHIARKRDTIQLIERMRRITPKLHVIRRLRIFATSLGSIQNVETKNCACSGWNTIYARKLPKNITATRKIDPIHLRRVRGLRGSFFFFGGSFGVGEFWPFSEAFNTGNEELSLVIGFSCSFPSQFEAEIISFKRDDVGVGSVIIIKKFSLEYI